MERIREAYQFLQIKLYGPPVPTAVILPFPQPFSTEVRKTAADRKRRRSLSLDRDPPVVQKRARPTLSRSVKDYAIRLEKLVSGLERIERAEQTKKDIREQITEHAAHENVDLTGDAKPLDDLLSQQVALDQTIRDELNELSTHADHVLDSIDDQRRNPLPRALITQLRRYDDARHAFVAQRVSEGSEKDDEDVLRTINGTLFQAENRLNNRGWIPTQGLLPLLSPINVEDPAKLTYCSPLKYSESPESGNREETADYSCL